jgi:hypothetical protein
MIVLDTNTFHSVFDPDSSDHAEFYPVLQWINKQSYACFVYGGTKYKKELSKMTEYHRIMNEFKKVGKCVEIDTKKIDKNENQLKEICTDADFNDEHIVAILNISGCKLVCTKGSKAMPYIKRKEFYSDQKIRKIYSSAKNKDLLSKTNVVDLKHKC